MIQTRADSNGTRMGSSGTADEHQPGELREAIGNLAVRVFADNVGRGPTRVRTLLERDVVVCLLEDTMTKAERRLLESGRDSTVREVRHSFHETMREQLSTEMEALLGRRVRAVVAGTHLEPDITTQVFVLGEAYGDEAAMAAAPATAATT